MDVEGGDRSGMKPCEEVGPSNLPTTSFLNRCSLVSDSLWERTRSDSPPSLSRLVQQYHFQVTKPLPPSQLGERRFPDQNPAGPAMSPYYPGLGGVGSQASLAQYDIGDPSYVCSPQSTIIAVLMVIGGLFLGLIAGFVFFYRMKRKHWSKVSPKQMKIKSLDKSLDIKM